MWRPSLDGSDPTSTGGLLYEGPIPAGSNITIKALASATGLADSEIASATYGIATGAVPVITNLSPQSGPAGTAVTIRGRNFGAAQGAGTITIGGLGAGTASSWSDTEIIVYVPDGAATGDIVVNVGGAASNSKPFTVLVRPAVSSISPLSGPVGTPVTILGSGFGVSQGGSTVTFGGALARDTNWSESRLTLTVPDGAITGNVVVTVGGLSSSGVYFTVTATRTISSVFPVAGLPGDTITITGAGFGAEQSIGKVWLGTAYGNVVSWSDTQIVAMVAAGSKSGRVQMLQNGVWSNAVEFGINTPALSDVTPASGLAGMLVTITGTGFGSAPGSGSVQLGSLAGNVQIWSDTQVVASVATGSVTGLARVKQNGEWSNAVVFTIPGSASGVVTLAPNLINMMVGETRKLQAMDSASHPVTGLGWTSSDPAKASVATDEPVMITAQAAGHVTITAGEASCDVTVYDYDTFPNGLPVGTTLWSNPGNGSGVTKIVPAVPSASGVADVFACQADGTVQAITSEGVTAWTADVSNAVRVVPDFQGGLIVVKKDFEAGEYELQHDCLRRER